MKKTIKYSFSILLLASCLILFTILAVKVLILDKESETEDLPPETPPQAEENLPAKKALPEDAPFAVTDAAYLADALFIGDSRTVGLREYGQIEGADFFATTGMSVYNVSEQTASYEDLGEVGLEALLSKRIYGKIYVMLGINEVGYDITQTADKYRQLLDIIQAKQPNALVFIEANLHVAAGRSDTDNVVNNDRINQLNAKLSELIDNQKIFYIDANDVFDDENGNLNSEYTSDNTHIYAKNYGAWSEWLLTKAILPEEADKADKPDKSKKE